ncbi:molybdenum cofactor biosynthesis protein MoaE [Campylobacterota bacterium]|nr:molybdenum cofactor biosynthesis protein MoaE [Campylobacterota bacterium]
MAETAAEIGLLEIYEGALPVEKLLAKWYGLCARRNLGAFVSFAGTVREENGISALSFDIYQPLLTQWFEAWKRRSDQTVLFMAHATGNVLIGESSFVAAVGSSKRRAALETIDIFVEDFKTHAPIWKYDIINGERVFAADRAFELPASGILQTA